MYVFKMHMIEILVWSFFREEKKKKKELGFLKTYLFLSCKERHLASSFIFFLLNPWGFPKQRQEARQMGRSKSLGNHYNFFLFFSYFSNFFLLFLSISCWVEKCLLLFQDIKWFLFSLAYIAVRKCHINLLLISLLLEISSTINYNQYNGIIIPY